MPHVPKMKLIGENVNVMTKIYGAAMKDRDKKPIQELVELQVEKGMDVIDLNIGPASRGGDELMRWLVETVQEVTTDIPCALDTSNIDAIRAGLEVHKGRAFINSIMVRPERMEALLPMAAEFECDWVGLLWGPEGMPRDENERGMLAAELLASAADLEIAPERIWLDPIVTPVNVQQNQVEALLLFMHMFDDLAPGCFSTCGLSNVSNGAPEHLRPILNKTYLIMCKRLSMYSAIVDVFDEDLHKIARGEWADLEALIHKVIDGEDIDMSSLSKEEVGYVKTAKVLLGHTLYSDSWLEL